MVKRFNKRPSVAALISPPFPLRASGRGLTRYSITDK